MSWLARWLRLHILRAELREVDREEQEHKDAAGRAWLKRAEIRREIESLEVAR